MVGAGVADFGASLTGGAGFGEARGLGVAAGAGLAKGLGVLSGAVTAGLFFTSGKVNSDSGVFA